MTLCRLYKETKLAVLLVMSQESVKIQVELQCSSEIQQDLLELLGPLEGPLKSIIVRSIDRTGRRLHLEL